MDEDPEEFVRMKYARDDEAIRPWAIRDLSRPLVSNLGFYPASDFGVLTKLIQQPKHLVFPEAMHISRNHYKKAWSLKTFRRIKNIIVLMDWVPNVTALKPQPTPPGRHVSPEQDRLLKNAFSLLDFDGDGKLGEDEFRTLLRALDVDVDDPHTGRASMLAIAKAAGVTTPLVTYDQVRELMRTQAFIEAQQGRFVVALSLQEAENLRGCLHIAGRGTGLVKESATTAALRLTDGTCLDSSWGYTEPPRYQRKVAEQCFRFLDSEARFGDRELDMLLRGVQDNDKYLREAWFVDVRACRRRQQVPVERTPVSRVFLVPDEFHLLQHRATITAVRRRIETKGLLVRDAFIAFNSSRTGALSCSEMNGALEWLGIRVTPSQVHDIVRTVDLDCDGYVSWEEFKHAFFEPTHGDDVFGEQLLGSSDWPDFEGDAAFTVPPKPMSELYSLRGDQTGPTIEEIAQARLEAFKLKVQKQERLERLWTTHGSASRSKCSIWAPLVTHGNIVQRNKVRLCLGYYARGGFSGWSRKDQDVEPASVEITDTGKWRLRHGNKLDVVADSLFPRPMRFREVWKKSSGDKALYVWRPVPPSSVFVALGMIATTTEAPPPQDSVRCVPRRWVVESTFKPVKVWDDVGTEGRAGSIWVVNSLHLMVATVGHDPPTGPFWDLKEDRFFMTPTEVTEIESASSGAPGSFNNNSPKAVPASGGGSGKGSAKFSDI
ncbi:unnamed protein product [Laminaria digitata]